MANSSFYGNNPTPTEYRDIDQLIQDAEDAAAVAQTAGAGAAASEAAAAASATQSANSAAASATSASQANAFSVSANTAKTDAQASATAAQTSATNSATSATSSANSASAAATSATNAATSAGGAAGSATTATVKANEAATSASAASNSATNAATSATAASNSATSAASSATTATTKASEAATSATNAANSAAAASTSANAASTSASNAATSATNAASSATAASNSATNADTARIAAESARDQTLLAYDSFDDRYLGAKASDPTVDNDGNPLVAGALYFNSVLGYMKVYTGTVWVDAYAAGTSFLAKANNLSDLPNVTTARSNLGLGSAATQASSAFAAAVHTHTASQISDSTTAGRALLTATDAAAQRTSLGLGTAALSATSDFAAAVHTHSISQVTGLQGALDGKAALVHTHVSTDVTDSTTTGRALLTTASASAARSTLGLGSAALSATSDFAAAVHTHVSTDITDSTTTGRSLLTTASASAARTTLGLGSAALLNTSGVVQQDSATGAANLPTGTTAQRPGTPSSGLIRYNSTTGKFEGYGSSWGNIGGGAAIGDTPPANPGAGDLWWESDLGRLFVYYTDANSSQWVDTSAGGAGQYLPLTGGDVTGNVTVTGNVGIGTSSPSSKLTVAGDSTATGNLFLSGQSTGDQYIRVGSGRTGNGYSYIDLQGDPTYSNGLRLIRLNSGANAPSSIEHRGTGALQFVTQEAAPIVFYTSGASERARIDASGRITMPNQPAFSVGRDGGNFGAGQVIVYNNTYTNTGNYYNTSTGNFTAPVSGNYIFYWYALNNQAPGNGLEVMLQVNGSNYADARQYSSSNNNNAVSGTMIVYLNANDSVRTYIITGTVYGYGTWYCRFGGHLIG